MSGSRLSYTAAAGALVVGTLLTGCANERITELDLSPDTPAAQAALTTAAPDAAAAPSIAPGPPVQNGLIAARAYVDQTRQSSAIFTLPADGSTIHQLTQPPGLARDDHPDWSPDATSIVFDRATPDSPSRIWSVDAAGSSAHQLPQLCQAGAADCLNEDEREPSYSPDGKMIALSRQWGTIDPQSNQIQYSDVFLMNSDGTNAQRLTFLTNDKPYSGHVGNPSWSPDGKRLAFEYRTSATANPANGTAIFVINADGTGLQQLTPWDLRAGDRPGWSPDGTRILFTTYPAGPEFTPGGGIYTVHPDGSTITALTPAPSDIFYGVASFSPDGQSIVYAQSRPGGSADLYTMKADGTAATQVVTSSDHWVSRADWAPAVGS
ncbi:TolB family protein [Kitasatospora sp. NPDC050543]|uniref:TolB family protein n=1 Tax=Kitasatospora sp. NPDC050543 TaxID=3364054 RepID=UPI0037B58565